MPTSLAQARISLTARFSLGFAGVGELELRSHPVLAPHAVRAEPPAGLIEDAAGARGVVVVAERRIVREVEREVPVAARKLRVARRPVPAHRGLHELRAVHRPCQRGPDGAAPDDLLVHARSDVASEVEDPVLEADRGRLEDVHAGRAPQHLRVRRVDRWARHHVEPVLLEVGDRSVGVAVVRHQHALRPAVAAAEVGDSAARIVVPSGLPLRRRCTGPSRRAAEAAGTPSSARCSRPSRRASGGCRSRATPSRPIAG